MTNGNERATQRAETPDLARSDGALPRIRKRQHGPFRTTKCGERAPTEVLRGIEQLNRGEYFEQHETLEHVWRREADDVRYLYQAILLVGVGCYHVARGNANGARIKLSRAVELLDWFRPACQGIDVARLITDVRRALATLPTAPAGPHTACASHHSLDRFPTLQVHLLDDWPHPDT